MFQWIDTVRRRKNDSLDRFAISIQSIDDKIVMLQRIDSFPPRAFLGCDRDQPVIEDLSAGFSIVSSNVVENRLEPDRNAVRQNGSH